VRKWESRSDLQDGPAAGFSTTQLATTIHAFRMAGLEVTLYGRFWVTPEELGVEFESAAPEFWADQYDPRVKKRFSQSRDTSV